MPELRIVLVGDSRQRGAPEEMPASLGSPGASC
jgi:hypothetical protein